MVTLTSRVRSPWMDAHFIGGHPVLDLANTVFDRTLPAEDVDLLNTSADVLTWCESAGLIDGTPPLTEASERGLVPEVRAVREHAWAVFSAIADGGTVPAEPFGALLQRAGKGMRAGQVQQIDAVLDHRTTDWAVPGAIPSALSLLVVHAVFTLPLDRVRACGRCGWLFLDSSRGGRRRWCSMSVCGNREKARRHRQGQTYN
ncbi:CGNR zinc finger domain-containing protein [Streptosporangium sp. DT93]|uniref:CGNR zinc finger domain-containing protein n=1 Tax=Streptosporangium sp. DT93 TaxID=3393428 RepID=UPI003CF8AA1F